MKRVKSIIGIIMVAAMIAVMAAFSASAAPMALNVAVNAGKVEVGQEVIATASVDGFPAEGLYTFTVKITYDATALKLTKVEPVNYGAMVTVEPDEALNANGVVAINWISGEIDKAITGVNDVAVLTFEALSEDAGAAISAAFPANSMLTLDEALKLENGEIPNYVQPGDDTYSDAVVPAPPVEIVPEGSLDDEEPGEGNTGSMAGESTGATGYSETVVMGTYAIGDRTNMYRVVVSWGSMEFTYTEADETWDPADHAWELDDETAVGIWTPAEDGVSNKISFVNHSSQPVTITFDFEDQLTEDTITATWSAEELTLDAVAGLGNAAVVDEDAVTMGLSGKFTNEAANSAVIGEATATIA